MKSDKKSSCLFSTVSCDPSILEIPPSLWAFEKIYKKATLEVCRSALQTTPWHGERRRRAWPSHLRFMIRSVFRCRLKSSFTGDGRARWTARPGGGTSRSFRCPHDPRSTPTRWKGFLQAPTRWTKGRHSSRACWRLFARSFVATNGSTR